MTSIKFFLDPGKLSNPDLDIRYNLPDSIIEAFGDGSLIDDGYDYEYPGSLLAIYLRADADLPAEAITRVVALALEHDSLGESLEPAMRILVDERLVFPSEI